MSTYVKRFASLAEEKTYGTAETEWDQSIRYLDLDLQPDQGRILEYESAERMKEISLLGPFLGSGTLSAWARPDTIGWFLKWLTGSVASAQMDTSTIYKHTFTLANEIDSFTCVDTRGLGQGVKSRAMSGCALKGMTLEAPARGVCSMEFDIQYAWEALVNTVPDQSLSTLRPFMFYDGAINLGGSALAGVESLRFVWSNDIPDDVHEIGSRKLPGIELQGVEVTMEMDLKFKSWAARQKFYGGTGTGSEPATEEKTFAFDATFTGEPTGDTTKPNYELVLDFDKVVVKETPSSMSRRDRLTERIVLEALKDAGNKIELYNKTASYPDAT